MFANLLNQTLASDPPLAQRLAALSGRTVRLVLPGLSGWLKVLPAGRFVRVEETRYPEATVRIPLDVVLHWPHRRHEVSGRIVLDGDRELGALVLEVLVATHWEPDELLSRLLGDAAAQRILSVIRGRGHSAEERWQRLAHSVAGYMQAETALLLSRPQWQAFDEELTGVQARLASLQMRLDRLEEGQ